MKVYPLASCPPFIDRAQHRLLPAASERTAYRPWWVLQCLPQTDEDEAPDWLEYERELDAHYDIEAASQSSADLPAVLS